MKANATINVSVSNHYREPRFASEIVSQGILGERVTVLEEHELFGKICQADGYTSWIDKDQYIIEEQQDHEQLCVTSHFLRIHSGPDRNSAAVRDAVIGCRLQKIGEDGEWWAVLLPGNESGWAPKTGFGTFPIATPLNIIRLAQSFLGYQYSWGGKSPKGFDCSGFVQTVYGLLGVSMARDSYQQQELHLLSTKYSDVIAGDLLFFGKTPQRVTHVAIALGAGRFIHASGWVRHNSFNESDQEYSEKHHHSFISVNRYPLPR
jgi:hypothetical protein